MQTTHEYSRTKPPWSYNTRSRNYRWWADSTRGLAQSTLLRRIFLLVKISSAAPSERMTPMAGQPAKFSSSVENGYSVDPLATSRHFGSWSPVFIEEDVFDPIV